jgi:hypothetical protein
LCTPRKTFRSITHPKIALGQTRLTPEFFTVGLSEKKIYLGGMSILSILLSLESECHNEDIEKVQVVEEAMEEVQVVNEAKEVQTTLTKSVKCAVHNKLTQKN